MTQEDKDLLLKDICARIPYGVKCSFGVDDAIYEVCGVNPTCCGASEIQATHIESGINGDFKLNSCKPYLFPLSSMNEEQIQELESLMEVTTIPKWGKFLSPTPKYYDWLNKNHFDYRGLIPMGLAIDATNLNIY